MLNSCFMMNQQIISIIRNMRKGKHSTAYIQLNNIFKQPKYGLNKEKCTRRESSIFYRMRIIEDRRNVDRRSLFHIPFDMRDKVTTERYSFPGLPCLYLGKSLYVCWEEMNRPSFPQIMISAFKPTRELNLLDLCTPSPSRWKDMDKRLIPLILSCQVVVRDKKAIYKSEYIVPQLIMEYIITSSEYDGVIYSSVHGDNQFFYPSDKSHNIAIPAIQDMRDDRFSSKLIDLFEITEPTCEEYERMNCHIGFFEKSTAGVIQNRNYENSIFNDLERVLKDRDLFHFSSINLNNH